MKARILMLTSVTATMVVFNLFSQTAPGGGATAGGTSATGGSSSTSAGTRSGAPEPLAPGAQGRQQFQRQTVPPGAIAGTNQFVATNQFGTTTNQFLITNQFTIITNQALVLSNQFTFSTNQNGLTPTSSFTNTARIFPTNAAVFTNLPGALIQDRAVAPTDRPILAQIHQVVQRATPAGSRLTTVRFIVQQGMVIVIGSVPSVAEKQQIINAIQGISGVSQVVDRLRAGPGAASGTSGSTGIPVLGTTGIPAANTIGVPAISGVTLLTNQFGIVTTNVGNVPLTPTSDTNTANRVFSLPPGQ